ncbi:MAG: ABC transporter substrate-binding protein [Alphaproteobacteria bacterium]|nr:ABC transporter substrate-binding protein [Alphaproteobacteria bacterium]
MAHFRRTKRLVTVITLGLGVLITFSANAGQESARLAVERFHDTLLSVMKEAENLGYEGRYEWLTPVIKESFNLPFMTSRSTGRHWKKASTVDHQALIDAFTNMTIANYASRFDGYSGEIFEMVEVTEGPRDSILVKTKIVKDDGEKVALNYVMREFDGQWQVIDIFLKGTFSELATRKSEYSSLIRDGGFPKLIARMKEKTETIRNKNQE